MQCPKDAGRANQGTEGGVIMKYLTLPLARIHDALVQKRVTPLQLVQEALRLAKEDTCHCFEILFEEDALALAASLKEPEKENLLWGIPYAAKNNFAVKGVEVNGSSRILQGYHPLYNATVIERLSASKAILIGMTSMDELALGGAGVSPLSGPIYNPYDPEHERMIGGSSAGSAAAVSAGIVPFALGSDTGDSVRKPASYGGVIGLKPTWGRISRYGLYPFAPSMDTVGFFTRYVEDAAIVLELLSGKDERDYSSSKEKVDPYSLQCKTPLSQPRVLVIDDIVNGVKDKVVRESFERALLQMAEDGVEVAHISFLRKTFSRDLKLLYPIYLALSSAEAISNDACLDGIKYGIDVEAENYRDLMRKARSDGFGSEAKRRFILGAFAMSKEHHETVYMTAARIRHRIASTLNDLLAQYDFILAPTCPSIAPRFDSPRKPLEENNNPADHHLILGNLAGLPSISLPLGYEDAMPFGINIMGRAFDESRLLSFALAFEKRSGLCGEYYGKKE